MQESEQDFAQYLKRLLLQCCVLLLGSVVLSYFDFVLYSSSVSVSPSINDFNY